MLSNLDDKYELAEELGRGATAIVYRAIDRVLKRSVALKRMQLAANVPEADRKQLVARFLQEGHTLARMSHAHIPKVLEIGASGTTPAIVMELIHGTKLYESLQNQPALKDVIRWLAQIAGALHYAHCQGVVHRDLKPENIIVTADQGAYLMDFGVARQEESAMQTSDGTMLGTIAYMAPEQLYNSAKADARCDIYSLGVVMYEVFTGQLPFDGDSPAAVILKIFNSDPRPPLEVAPALPPALGDLMLHCLQKDPQQRIQTAKQVAYTLIQLANSVSESDASLPDPAQTQIGIARPSAVVLDAKQTLGELAGLRLSKEQELKPDELDTAGEVSEPEFRPLLEADGSFSCHGLFVALEQAINDTFTGAIKVKAREQGRQACWFKGVVWLDQGQILHAQLIREPQSPEAALRELLGTDDGQCQRTPNTPCPCASFSHLDSRGLLQSLAQELGLNWNESGSVRELFDQSPSERVNSRLA